MNCMNSASSYCPSTRTVTLAKSRGVARSCHSLETRVQAERVGLSLASVKINVISSGGRSEIDLMLEVPFAAANDSGES